MEYYTYLERWNKIKEEAKISHDLYVRDAHIYLEEMAPLIDLGLETLNKTFKKETPKLKSPKIIAKKKSPKQSKKRKR